MQIIKCKDRTCSSEPRSSYFASIGDSIIPRTLFLEHTPDDGLKVNIGRVDSFHLFVTMALSNDILPRLGRNFPSEIPYNFACPGVQDKLNQSTCLCGLYHASVKLSTVHRKLCAKQQPRKSQNNDNPVYYVQYAHARVCSVMEQWGEDPSLLTTADTSQLSSAAELSLLQKLIDYPEIVAVSARDLSPHLVAFYLRELAAEFHSYYNSSRFLVPEIPIRLARLALISSIRQVLVNGLTLLGVSAPAKM